MQLEIKYINAISFNLRNFKKLSGELFNFSCPICGDSQTNKGKARGYIYEKNALVLYHCHNCSITINFQNFLKNIDANLHKEYIFEKFQNSNTKDINESHIFAKKMKTPKFLDFAPLKKLKKISKLTNNDPVRKYVIGRKIPTNYHYKLFSCPNFKSFTNEIIPGKFKKTEFTFDETRLLIPFINSKNEIHAYQGRSIGDSDLKYITITIDENIPKVYGLDTTNFNKEVFVFEGPIDSMFIENSIATAGGDITSTINKFDKENLTIVYDNEPRSLDTKKKIDKAINLGYKVCIWPDYIKEKDVNNMVLSGMKQEVIEQIIRQNTFANLYAKAALTKWSKY